MPRGTSVSHQLGDQVGLVEVGAAIEGGHGLAWALGQAELSELIEHLPGPSQIGVSGEDGLGAFGLSRCQATCRPQCQEPGPASRFCVSRCDSKALVFGTTSTPAHRVRSLWTSFVRQACLSRPEMTTALAAELASVSLVRTERRSDADRKVPAAATKAHRSRWQQGLLVGILG